MGKESKDYEQVIKNHKIPILVLDNKWHQIFTKMKKTKQLEKDEEQMHELLKRQGKLNNDLKEIKKLKNKLMKELIVISNEARSNPDDEKIERKLEEHKRLIEECNQKTEEYEDEVFQIPRTMDALNQQMMLQTMNICYTKIQKNQEDIKEIAKWITQVRIELKKNLIRKQERELGNQELYTYLHDIFGPNVIEMFDMQYNPEKTGEKSETSTEFKPDEGGR